MSGGYPPAQLRSPERARQWHRQTLRTVLDRDVADGGWTDPDLRFWHYRDKDQVELDLVITRGRRTWGVEVKASATVTPADGKGLRRLAEQCGKDFQGGMIPYAGTCTLPTADRRVLAVPLSELWRQ